MPEMEFDFWQLCSAEWLLLGTRFCASLLSCGCSVYFFLNLISVFQWNFLIFAVFSVDSHLETTTCCFPVEIPASSSLCLVSVCRQVWKVSCSTAVGRAERVLGQKCWFYRHWCTHQHSRGAVTLWARRIMDPPACCSCLLPWYKQISSPGSLVVDKRCLVGRNWAVHLAGGVWSWTRTLSAGVTSELSQELVAFKSQYERIFRRRWLRWHCVCHKHH